MRVELRQTKAEFVDLAAIHASLESLVSLGIKLALMTTIFMTTLSLVLFSWNLII